MARKPNRGGGRRQPAQPQFSVGQLLAFGLMQNIKPLAWLAGFCVGVFFGLPYLRDIAVAWAGKNTTVEFALTVSWVWGGLSSIAAVIYGIKYRATKRVQIGADGVTKERSRALGVSVRREEE